MTAASIRDAAEREALEAALAETGWNIRAAAALMGVNRRTIYHWLKRFGLERPGGKRFEPAPPLSDRELWFSAPEQEDSPQPLLTRDSNVIEPNHVQSLTHEQDEHTGHDSAARVIDDLFG